MRGYGLNSNWITKMIEGWRGISETEVRETGFLIKEKI